MQTRNYILVGPMGAGKSTIGRLLAKELGLPFKDSDKEIEERTGASIPLIFDVEGETGFRDREQAEEHTSELQSRPHLVCRLLLEKKKTPINRLSPATRICTSPSYSVARPHSRC